MCTDQKTCGNCGHEGKECEYFNDCYHAHHMKSVCAAYRAYREQKERADKEKHDKLHLAMELDNILFIASADEANNRVIRSIVQDALFEVGLEKIP